MNIKENIATDNIDKMDLPSAQWSKVLLYGRNIHFGYVWKK